MQLKLYYWDVLHVLVIQRFPITFILACTKIFEPVGGTLGCTRPLKVFQLTHMYLNTFYSLFITLINLLCIRITKRKYCPKMIKFHIWWCLFQWKFKILCKVEVNLYGIKWNETFVFHQTLHVILTQYGRIRHNCYNI